MSRFSVLIGVLLAFSGCATVGQSFDTTHVNEVKNGAQDKTQILAWFGAPTTKTSSLSNSPSGCVERWQWTYAHSAYGGTRTIADSLVIDFDGKDKVCDHAYSQTK